MDVDVERANVVAVMVNTFNNFLCAEWSMRTLLSINFVELGQLEMF